MHELTVELPFRYKNDDLSGRTKDGPFFLSGNREYLEMKVDIPPDQVEKFIQIANRMNEFVLVKAPNAHCECKIERRRDHFFVRPMNVLWSKDNME